MTSSWEQTKLKSNYHFNNKHFDPNIDKIIKLGKIEIDLSENEIQDIITNSLPTTWRTRAPENKPRQDYELEAEENDLERFGYGKNYKIINLNWNIPEKLKVISKKFGLADCMERIHVQMPGEVWNLHIDKLEKWDKNNPGNVLRIQIALTDWQPGQFWSYGNYVHSMWEIGEVTTFDWVNLPHSTANASHYPRVTFQLTGLYTKITEEYLEHLKAC